MRAAPEPPRRGRRILALLVAAGVAATGGLALQLGGFAHRHEDDTVDVRFQMRAPAPPPEVAVVAIDDLTFSRLRVDGHKVAWPFPRSLHARAIDRLTAAGAKAIVYDVQFTEPSSGADGEAQDLALYDAVARSGRVVLATTETDENGGTDVLGGDANLAAANARAAAANLSSDAGEVIRRFPHSVGGLESLAVVAAERATGRELRVSQFPSQGAWIDYAGPPGTVPTTSFVDLLEGRTPASAFRGRVVVVGATAPSLQDVHPTPTADSGPMAGPEVQANAIVTAMRGLPLRSAPPWLDLLAVVLLAVATPLMALRLPLPTALAGGLALGAGHLAAVHLAFGAGLILAVAAPMVALVLGLAGAVVARYLGESRERRRYAWYSAVLEREVQERTADLRLAQLEIVQRLGHAVDWREVETGRHIERVGRLCEALALATGMPAHEAESIRLAAALHDVGKIGVPDRVLMKQGALDSEEWALMRGHTTIGGEILAGSASPLVRYAEEIARTHHERWDGNGYPDGLAGTGIPLSGRICAICDVFDALLSHRSYKEGWPLEVVLREMRDLAGSQFDPALVEVFIPIAPALYEELGYAGAALPAGDAAPAR